MGDVPYYGANGIQGYIDKPIFNEPLILLAEDGGNFDEYATRPIAYRIAGPSWVNNHAHVLRPASGVDFSFLFFSLEHRDVRWYIRGGTRSKLNRGELCDIDIALPSSDSEQRAIGALLDAHETRVATEQGCLSKLTFIKQGLMQDLLTGRKRVPVDLIHTDSPVIVELAREKKANIYFMRSVLAAEIVEQMHEHATFGHVKFQKTLFLCERVAGLDLETRYHRAAAGPHDNRLMRSVDGQMEKQKWFRKVPRGVGADGKPVGWAYERMEKAGGHREWFEKYWTPARERIQRVIDLLRPLDTRRCEVVATLYSAWEDLLAAECEATDDAIVNEVLTNWHESKQAIPRKTWIRALGWMRQISLVPISTQVRGEGEGTT